MSRDRREGRKKRVAACCCSAIVTLVPKMEQGSAAYDVRNTLTILDSLPFLHLVSIKNGVFQLNLLKFGTISPPLFVDVLCRWSQTVNDLQTERKVKERSPPPIKSGSLTCRIG